mmetsp:Transcript_7790/g.9652  ORF Transcript_7790/g.9652 Transcript_7790/m.9652 type:complete len:87 (+) Transcript_7790:48-308(+)
MAYQETPPRSSEPLKNLDDRMVFSSLPPPVSPKSKKRRLLSDVFFASKSECEEVDQDSSMDEFLSDRERDLLTNSRDKKNLSTSTQ